MEGKPVKLAVSSDGSITDRYHVAKFSEALDNPVVIKTWQGLTSMRVLDLQAQV